MHDYKGCLGTPNMKPLITQKPVLNQQVPHGQKYIIPYEGRNFYILNLTGNAYEMGFAYGTLLKEEIPIEINQFFDWAATYLENNVTDIISRLPKFLKTIIGKTGVKLARALLDLNYVVLKKYIPKRYEDEIRGIAKAVEVTERVFKQINMVPELLKASCSVLGAYGKATPTGKTIHLRALDWDAHAPMSRWPLIVVYHSTEEGSVPYANFGWPSFIGSITGYNSMKVGIGERLGDDPQSDQSRIGKPWNFVLRDALQFSKSQPEAIQYLINAQRTCSLYLGVGAEDFFNICEYSHKALRVYNWTNWHFDDYHPKTEDTLWKEYQNSICFNDIIQQNQGKINPELIYRYIAPMTQTGDSQVAIFDYSNDTVYLQYPSPITKVPGYFSSPIQIDLRPFFNKQTIQETITE